MGCSSSKAIAESNQPSLIEPHDKIGVDESRQSAVIRESGSVLTGPDELKSMTHWTPLDPSSNSMLEERPLRSFFPETAIPDQIENEFKSYEEFEVTALPKGREYQGRWDNGLQSGLGRMVYEDIGTYLGQWVEGKAHGFGIYTAGKHSAMTGSYYKGTFKNGKANGYGVFRFQDDSFYFGLFKGDKRHGVGLEFHHDDLEYIGPYDLGKKKGIGRLLSPNGECFLGSFANNELDGYGVYRWPDGRLYEGTWKKSLQHGKGRFTWPDGRVYTGDYEDGKISGRGVLMWADGRRYDGEWSTGLQDGIGDYYFTETRFRRASFVEGVRTKWLSEPIDLPVRASTPVHNVPTSFRGLLPDSLLSMDRFYRQHLMKYHHFDELYEAVTTGQMIEDVDFYLGA